MEKLPTVICSSVIRSSKQGESHGGIYLVDLETEKINQMVDWNDNSISWEGRGSDRGLRGITFYYQYIICAASNEIFFYDQDASIAKSFKNPYLKHCHEIFVEGDLLYLSSTGFDTILVFDLKFEKFIQGYQFRRIIETNFGFTHWLRRLSPYSIFEPKPDKDHCIIFDPTNSKQVSQVNKHHINNVFVESKHIYFSGTKLDRLMKIDINGEVSTVCKIPYGTHNVRFYKDHLIYNDTKMDQVVIKNLQTETQFTPQVIRYDESILEYASISKDHARQSFGRGLCFYQNYVIAGSSPSTISVYELETGKRVKYVNLSKDIRNAIHGLEVIE